MKTQGRIVLIVVFFVGLLGLWAADRMRVPDRQKRLLMEPRVLPELIDTRPDELRRIEILGDSETLTLERKGTDRWTMTSPYVSSADPSLVETLALNLKTLTKSRDAGAIANNEAANFGLAPAEKTIRLWGESTDKPLAVLEVGKSFRDRRYVRNANGGQIEVVEGKLFGALSIPIKAWRDRALFHIPTFQVERIEVERGETRMALERDRNHWQIVTPWQAPADETTIEAVLAGLTSLRAIQGDGGVVESNAKDLTKYGLDQPTLAITLIGAQGRDRQRLLIGKPAPRPTDTQAPKEAVTHYARRDSDNDVMIVDARSFLSFGNPADLRAKAVANLALPLIDFVSVQMGDDSVSLARSQRGWSRVLPKTDEADNQAVYNLVKTVAELQASALLAPGSVADSGLDKPSAVIRVWENGNENRSVGSEPKRPAKLVLKVGRHDTPRHTVYVQAGDEPNILAVPDTLVSSLPRGVLAFRTRKILALASNLVARFTVEGGSRRYVLEAGKSSKASDWRMTLPVNAPIDHEAFGQLLLLLGNLRVESFVTESPKDLKTYGLDHPWRVVSWDFKPDPTQRKDEPPVQGSLLVGRVAEGGKGSRYAKLGSSDTIFTLGPEQAALLDAEWRDRNVLGVDANRIQAIDMRWRDFGLKLIPIDDRARSQRNWKVESPVLGIGFSPKRIPELVGALGGFRAVKFTQFDGPIPKETGLATPKLSISIHQSAIERPKTLRIGALAPEGYLFATTAEGNEGPVFLISLASWEGMTRPPIDQVNPPQTLP